MGYHRGEGLGQASYIWLPLHAGASTAASVDDDLVQGAVYWVIDPAATSQAYTPAILTQGWAALFSIWSPLCLSAMA